MKKFKFRLERVLHYRNLVKDEKRRQLLKRNQELREAQDRLQMLEAEAEANKMTEVGVTTAGRIYLAGVYSDWLDQAIAMQKLEIIRREEAVEAARSEYIEAAKESEALETLKRRRRTEYDEYVQREEFKFLDELTTQKGNTFKKEGEL